jgi:gamma-glutamylcyclotransferase (GGCT)/AIG2-like uncharacterized protein YtfP
VKLALHFLTFFPITPLQQKGKTMRARIYQPAKTAMQSGTAKAKGWVLEFAPASARDVDPLMQWTSSSDTQAQVKLRFDSKEAALAYATAKGIEVDVTDPKPRKPVIRAGGYGENFATGRRGAWTH